MNYPRFFSGSSLPSLTILLIKICKILPPDLLFLFVFISFFYISRYNFSKIFRTSFNSSISEKNISVTNFPFLMDLLRPPIPFFFCTHWKFIWQIHFNFLINFTLHINSADFFHSNFLEILLTERALDSLKPDVTKKIISQELKQISPSYKKQWKAYLILI